MYDYFAASLAGILSGLVIALMIGPVFFVLLQTSIKKGMKHAVAFSGGIVSSDILFYSATFLGVSSIIKNPMVNYYLGFFGGVFLILYGLVMLIKKVKIDKEVDAKSLNISLPKSYLKGFVINSLNPSVIPLWAGIVIKMQRNFSAHISYAITFSVSCLAIIFLTDITKAALAFKLKDIISDVFISRMNKLIGIVMIGVGSKMLYSVLTT